MQLLFETFFATINICLFTPEMSTKSCRSLCRVSVIIALIIEINSKIFRKAEQNFSISNLRKTWSVFLKLLHAARTDGHREGNRHVFETSLRPSLKLLGNHVLLKLCDDDFLVVHIYGVRFFLWIAATNGPIVHPLGDIWVWRAKVEWYWRKKQKNLYQRHFVHYESHMDWPGRESGPPQ
jgi:hypothetical protein